MRATGKKVDPERLARIERYKLAKKRFDEAVERLHELYRGLEDKPAPK